jgi:hypothetical protein
MKKFGLTPATTAGCGPIPKNRARGRLSASRREKRVSERLRTEVFHAFVGTFGNPVLRAVEEIPQREPDRPPLHTEDSDPGPDPKDSKSVPPVRKFRFRGLGAQIHSGHGPASRKRFPAGRSGRRPRRPLPPQASTDAAQSTIAISAITTGRLKPAKIQIASGDRDRQVRAR